MDKILNLDNVDQYNQLYGIETLHPLVSVVNLNEATYGVDFIRLNYGCLLYTSPSPRDTR